VRTAKPLVPTADLGALAVVTLAGAAVRAAVWHSGGFPEGALGASIDPWARTVALLAGLLAIPVAFAAAARFTGTSTAALPCAALIAFWPRHLQMSVGNPVGAVVTLAWLAVVALAPATADRPRPRVTMALVALVPVAATAVLSVLGPWNGGWARFATVATRDGGFLDVGFTPLWLTPLAACGAWRLWRNGGKLPAIGLGAAIFVALVLAVRTGQPGLGWNHTVAPMALLGGVELAAAADGIGRRLLRAAAIAAAGAAGALLWWPAIVGEAGRMPDPARPAAPPGALPWILAPLVAVLLVAMYRPLARAHGATTVNLLIGMSAAFFLVKECLQARGYLIRHTYRPSGISVITPGVSPFVLVGHVFVVLLSWQLALRLLERFSLREERYLLPAMTFLLTAGFALPIESIGGTAGWWAWEIPAGLDRSFFGLPLRHLPRDRVMTTAWGYFVGGFWLVLVATGLLSERRPKAPLALLAALGGALVLAVSRYSEAIDAFTAALLLVPLLAAALGAAMGAPPDPPEAFAVRTPRPSFDAVGAGLTCMFLVCLAAAPATARWEIPAAFAPLLVFYVGGRRRGSPWVDLVGPVLLVVAGLVRWDGNLALAGDIALRPVLFLVAYAALRRFRSHPLGGAATTFSVASSK
jgi:hypothetical protein